MKRFAVTLELVTESTDDGPVTASVRALWHGQEVAVATEVHAFWWHAVGNATTEALRVGATQIRPEAD